MIAKTPEIGPIQVLQAPHEIVRGPFASPSIGFNLQGLKRYNSAKNAESGLNF